MPIPPACQIIQDEIDSLRQERNELQEELHHAAPREKPTLLQLIRRINLQLHGLQTQLDDCIASQPPEPPPLPPIEAIQNFCRWMGFRRAGPIIDEAARSLIQGWFENRGLRPTDRT
jgi:hypothetical protein